MVLSAGYGFALAITSAITNGTFSVPSKLGPVKRANVEPYIFNLYMCFGVGVTSLCFLFFVPFTFEWLGLLSGLFLSFSTLNAFRATSLLGISVGAGIWSGTAAIVSFIFGYFFDHPVSNLIQGIAALVVIVVSIAGMAFAERRCSAEMEEAATPLLDGGQGKGEDQKSFVFINGIVAAIACGTLGGLVNAPEHFAQEAASGLNFIPSFGIGVLICAPILTAIPFLIRRELPKFAFKECVPLGLLSGLIWNISNIASLLAIGSIGFNIALPLMQCGLFVAGLWGIFLFGEINGRSQWIYWVSGVTLAVGAVLLFSAK